MSCFQIVGISQVIVPEQRRRQTKGIDDLAAAIREAGRLINPITVTEGLVLSAGFRRLMACKSLGWETIPVHIISKDQLDANLVEIAENLHRQELTALERAEQVTAWKAAWLAKHPQAGHGKTPGKKGGKGGKAPSKEPISGSLLGEMQKATGKKPSTNRADTQIGENIPQEIRDAIRDTPVAERQAELLKLARLPEADQKKVAEKIQGGEAKNVPHAVKLCRADEINAEPPPLPAGPFRVLVIDPPWQYSARENDSTHQSANPYPSMTVEEICAMPIADLAAEDCILWLWITNAHIIHLPEILSAWGFAHKTILTWVKDYIGPGDWLRGQTEHCVMAVRGKPTVTCSNQSTVIHAKRREHSRKPEEFYALVESLCPGSKCELFARAERPGWTSHGNQTTLFSATETA